MKSEILNLESYEKGIILVELYQKINQLNKKVALESDVAKQVELAEQIRLYVAVTRKIRESLGTNL